MITLHEMLRTFTDNKAFREFLPVAIEKHIEMKRDEYNRLKSIEGLYEKRAAEYYAKHGTVGEF